MTRDDLHPLLEQYGAGLEAALALLHQLTALARQQHEASRAGRLEELRAAVERRDDLTRNLAAIEEELCTARQILADHRELAHTLEEFERVTARHREAEQLIAGILSTDRESLAALADAELVRRSAVASLERGEATLACYRRVLAPPAAHATLVNRRG